MAGSTIKLRTASGKSMKHLLEEFKFGSFGDIVSPASHLAVMIVCRALLDLLLIGDKDCKEINGAPVSKEELIEFFRSPWCDTLISFQNGVTQNEMVRFMEPLLISSSYHKTTKETSQKN